MNQTEQLPLNERVGRLIDNAFSVSMWLNSMANLAAEFRAEIETKTEPRESFYSDVGRLFREIDAGLLEVKLSYWPWHWRLITLGGAESIGEVQTPSGRIIAHTWYEAAIEFLRSAQCEYELAKKGSLDSISDETIGSQVWPGALLDIPLELAEMSRLGCRVIRESAIVERDVCGVNNPEMRLRKASAVDGSPLIRSDERRPSQTGETLTRPLDRVEFIEELKANRLGSTETTVTKYLKQFGKVDIEGSGGRSFRLNASKMKDCRFVFPSGWIDQD